ncbi:golgin subfamily A member 6-like protein 24 [Sardina pilchardus]|uniref:golgin subfamily A member 6-like protein 24 n=1 Tax=Sardina pilchardus TaxID=27697 RepID=UPI002E15FBC9
MGFLWIFNCCKAQQEDDDAEQWFFARECEAVWYGFDSEWESIQDRKQRLKKYSLEDLKKQLELFGITIVEEKGQKKHKSEKKMKREYRKLLMRRMKIVETERARRSVQFRRMKPEEKMDLVKREPNDLDQESENTHDEKQSLKTSEELIPQQQGLRATLRVEAQEREDNKEDIKDEEVEKVNDKDCTDAQETGRKQELDLRTKTRGEKEEEEETDFNKINEEDDSLKGGKREKSVIKECEVKLEESEKKQENTDDGVASGTMATVSLELQNEDHEEKQEEATVKEERVYNDGKVKDDEELIEEKEEGVNVKGKEGQEEVTECVVEIKEKNVEDIDMATALVTTKKVSDMIQSNEVQKEEPDVAVLEKEGVKEDGMEEKEIEEKEEEEKDRKLQEVQEEVKDCMVDVEEEVEENADDENTHSLDLAQNGNQEKEEEKAAEKDMMSKDETKESRVEDDKEVVIKEKEELAEVQEEKKAEDMKVKEEQEKVEIMVERKQKQVDITDGTVAMEMRPEVSLITERNATLIENRRGGKSKNKRNQPEVYKPPMMTKEENGQSMKDGHQLGFENQNRRREGQNTRKEVWRGPNVYGKNPNRYRGDPKKYWREPNRCWGQQKTSSGHTVEDGKELMDNKGKEDEKKKAKEKEDMKVQKEQEEVKECVLEVEEKEKEDTDDGTVAVETALKVSLGE